MRYTPNKDLLPASTTIEQIQSNPDALRPSPFQFRQSKSTGKWHPPRYSRRQQADLVKEARIEGLLHLLPTSIKSSVDDINLNNSEKPFNWQEKAAFDVQAKSPRAVAEKKFRGSLWERNQPKRQAAIEENMENMQQKIEFWKLDKEQQFPDDLNLKVHNEIPFGRGLGSSGAAVVAGVLLADALADLKLSPSRQLDFALMVERHPDNVAAALIGGFVGSYLKTLPEGVLDPSSVPMSEVLPEYPPDASKDWGKKPPVPPKDIGHWLRYGWASQIKALVVIPQFELSTAKARGCLPEQYSRPDVRLAVLTTALSITPPDPDLIWEAMQDKLHQPYRSELIPGLPEITKTLTPKSHPGLLGICLSGAGPTILALHTHNHEAIADGIFKIFAKNNVKCRMEVKSISESGSTVSFE
ncbi:homoserine kinase [Wallemia mellicola]|uniref:Homoserine kinase n=1 Tax=Wallemia mellicola TaxID=1708541 RepID=A0A4T0NHP4_9BASI|nr:hypothetical protein E3Q24_02991 [Wallemia mellicola]TIB88347.1 homoserine kinase [Wallemia mellicola]TIB91170.1 homoserine kinase [Wallemia mellicola]TIB96529.1 homoserine kinase [Wallemia mellicola]TIB98206.1 homoserine kinase [Wallemia mellicola]